MQGAMPAKQETLPQGSAKLEYWPLAAIVSAPDAKVSRNPSVPLRVRPLAALAKLQADMDPGPDGGAPSWHRVLLLYL